jgi:heme/copper-type cytochrome/quinol oxidase subunit 2
MVSQPPNHAAKELWKHWRWIFLFAVSALLILFAPLPLTGVTPTVRHIRIEASMSLFTPSELKISPGDRVTVELVSTDVVHGLSLDGYDFELRADPGQTAIGTFVADKAGVFRFRCSVACGNLHPFMIGKLQVGPNLLLVRGIALGLLAVIAAFFPLSKVSTNSLRSIQ